MKGGVRCYKLFATILREKVPFDIPTNYIRGRSKIDRVGVEDEIGRERYNWSCLVVRTMLHAPCKKETKGKRERGGRGRDGETMERPGEGGRIVESKIKVPGNVIYGIDLNPTFKPRAIIQSQSFSFLFVRLCALLTRALFLAPVVSPQGHARYSIYT